MKLLNGDEPVSASKACKNTELCPCNALGGIWSLSRMRIAAT